MSLPALFLLEEYLLSCRETINRPITMPDSSSVTRSPSITGSIRTILSIDSAGSSTSSGSRSTIFVPPLRSLPSIPDFSSNASSSLGTRRRTSLVSSHHTRTVDDTVISNSEYIYPGDSRAIHPVRGNSLRRSGSMTDLDEEFSSALRRAKGAKPGLGFAGVVLGSAPVTISSGPTLGRDVVVTPPPGSSRGSDRSRSEVPDEMFSSSGNESRSSFYSSYTSDLRTSTATRTNDTSTFTTGTDVVPSTLSLRQSDSASYLGDSHDSASYTLTSSSRTPLSRTREVRRRGGRSPFSSGGRTDGSIEKDDSAGSYTPDSGSYTSGLRSYDSRSYTHSSGSYTPGSNGDSNSASFTPSGSYSGSASYTNGGSYTGSGSYTPAGTYTPGGTYSGTDTVTPGVSSETAYNVCPSSDLSCLTGCPVTSTDDSLTPSSASPVWEPDRVSEGGSEIFLTASQGSSDYLTAKSPSLRGSMASPKGSITSFESFESLPSIPSESEYQTADSGYSHYQPFSEPSLDSEYITAELCPTIPSEHTPTRSSIKLSSEDSGQSILGLPSQLPEIPPSRSPPIYEVYPPLPPSTLSYSASVSSASPPLPPLPQSVPSITPPPLILSVTEESSGALTPSSFRASSPTSWPLSSTDRSFPLASLSMTTSSISVVTPSTFALSSSPRQGALPLTPVPELPSSISSPTSSSISSLSGLSALVPPFRARVPPSYYRGGQETDDSYESSQLNASPSAASLAVPEGLDVSFETSFLRPTGSAISSVVRLPIPETPTSLSAVTPHSPFPPLTPVPALQISASSSTEPETPFTDSSSSVGSSFLPLTAVTPLSSSSFPSTGEIATLRTLPSSTDSSVSLVRMPSIDSSASLVRMPSTDSSVSLARMPSTASTVSFMSQTSLSSSVFDSRSLFEEESNIGLGEAPSTEPSLLTTPSQASHPLVCSSSLHSIVRLKPLPQRSPVSTPATIRISTPEVSGSLTLTTPGGSGPSARPSFRTESSESDATQRDIFQDIDRLADQLRHYDELRGDENRGLSDNVRALRDELQDLSQFLRRTPPLPGHPSPAPVVSGPQPPTPVVGAPPPPLPPVDLPVQTSDIMTLMSPDARERDMSPVSLTRSLSSGSFMSFLSSHHSDDEYLLPTIYPDSPRPWAAPSVSDFHDSDVSSSSVSSDPASSSSTPLTQYYGSSQSSGRPFPPSSPTPSSSASAVTLRPLPAGPDLHESLNAIRDQLRALGDAQASTDQKLDNLRVPVPPVSDNTELLGRLQRIEDILRDLSNRQPDIGREATTVAAQDDRPSALFGSSPQSTLTSLTDLERRLRTFPVPEIPIAAPVPSRTGWVQQMVDDMLAAADLPHSRVDEPPELQRLTREPLEPAERGSRLRSPIVTHQDLPPRADTEPPPQGRAVRWLRPRPARGPLPGLREEREAPPPEGAPAPATEQRAPQPVPAIPVSSAEPTQPAAGVPREGPDVDFEQELRNIRRRRQPGTDGTYNAAPYPMPVTVCHVPDIIFLKLVDGVLG